ncbi:serine/threonine-protein kinase [Hamadaea tsunoensis]|uniref:serine/threonine-protein kinase n=1 Tax=Hamadaea tsunoensis TaxID=53368 RepID=UPI00146F96D8|nr:serine/threonine-protein kinase [Hamadaea tsunoensis]
MSEPLPEPPVQPGDLLDNRYELVEPVARGGMSTVWKAHDQRLRRDVAVKLLSPALLGHAQLHVEAETLARLRHPHIAEVYDCAVAYLPSTGRTPFLVMELIDGVPLASRLRSGMRLGWRQAVSITGQAASALAVAHERGIVHRDISPSNVLLTPAGVKVIDFGICAADGDTDADPDGLLVGTPAFLAPERIRGQPVEPAHDVYALGVLLYRMLTGRLPFTGETSDEMLNAHLFAAPAPAAVGGVPQRLTEICLRCLHKDPAARPTAAVLAEDMRALGGEIRPEHDDALQDLVLGALTTAVPGVAGPRPRHATRRLAVAGLAAVLVAGGVFLWTSRHSPAGGTAAAAGLPPSSAASCAVTYRQQHDDGRTYTATVTVADLTGQPVDPAVLSFSLGPDERPARTMDGLWIQQGRQVRTQPGALVLAANEGVEVPFAGEYAGVHALPVSFTLNGGACAVTVLAAGGQPLVTPSAPGARPSSTTVRTVLPAGPAAASIPAGPPTAASPSATPAPVSSTAPSTPGGNGPKPKPSHSEKPHP